MKLSDATHNGWMVSECAKCKNHGYAFGKISNLLLFGECGCKDVSILSVDKWNAADFLHTVSDEEFKPFISDVYDSFKGMVDKEELTDMQFAEIVKTLSNIVLQYVMERDGQ